MNRNEFTIVLVIQLTHAWVQAQMSPSGYCQISNQHTLCRYQGLSNQCGMPLKQGLDQNEVRTLVDVHNQLRSGLAQGQEGRGAPGPQPSASNMLEMTWDEELAAVAQRWADQCQFAHDAVRDVDRFKVGQNVYITTRSHDQPLAMTINEGVMGWYDEVRDVDRQIVDRYQFASATGHYTQLIWANTNRIGCGHVTYPSGRLLKKLLICNYGPSGNFIGSPMYQMGDPCSQCPSNTQCSVQYSGLCTESENAFGPISNAVIQPDTLQMPLPPFSPSPHVNPSSGSDGLDSISPPFTPINGNSLETSSTPRDRPTRPPPPPQSLLPPSHGPNPMRPFRFFFRRRPTTQANAPKPARRPQMMPHIMNMLGNIFRMPQQMFG